MRIAAMLMIVAGHFFGQSGFYTIAAGGDYWFANLVGSAARVAVNMFLMLGCWFMVDAHYKARRVTRLYLNVWCLTVPITIAVVALGFAPSAKDVARGLFPFVGKGVWFASAYLMLIFFSPWLHKVLEWPKRTLRQFLIVCLILISAWVTFWSIDRTEDQWLDILVWFSFMYVFIGYYKRYIHWSFNRYRVLFAGLVVYLLLMGVHAYAVLHAGDSSAMKFIAKLAGAYLNDYKTLPNFFVALCGFYFFQHMDLGSNKIINYIATGAFTTYIIHQTPVYISVQWHSVFQCDYFLQSDWRSVYAVGVILSTYLLCLLVERLRRRWVEPMLLQLPFVQFIERKLDSFYREV